MAIALFDRVTAIAAACSRQVSRASRRLWPRPNAGPSKPSAVSRRTSALPFLAPKKKLAGETVADDGDEGNKGRIEAEETEGVWRRTILMGEKCQPLDFSGAIYYDANGRKLDEIPTPRSPLRSPVVAFHHARH